MNQPHDPDMEFERPDDVGQDHYEEPAEYAESEDPLAAGVEKKPSPFINIAIFGGIGIFALVMAWINFGSVLFPKSNDAQSNNVTSQNATALLAPVTPNAPPSAQPVAPPPTAGMITPGAAPTTDAATPLVTPPPGSPVAAAPNPETAAPIIPGQPAAVAPTDVAALSVTPNAPITPPPAATPVAATPTAGIPAAGPAPVAPNIPTPQTSAVLAPSTIPTTPPVTTAPADNGKMADLQQQIQTLTAKNTDDETTINDLKSQLADAQSKLADAQTKLATAQTAAAPTSKTSPVKKKIAKKPALVHHVAVTKPAAPLTENTGASATPQADTLQAPPPYWVLRSAEGNSAWVAHPGDSQLYQVTVGDQLPGIGKIISLQQQPSGTWVVVGTQGQIRQ